VEDRALGRIERDASEWHEEGSRARCRVQLARDRPAELRALVEDKLRAETCAHWIEALNAVGVPCGPVLSIDQVFEDPQVQHLRMAQDVESPRYGSLTLVRSPVRLSRTSTSLRSAAPVPGADTAAVLAEYGYSPDEIAALEASGAISTAEQRRR
jgi:formyl-CoA transferase